MIIFMIYGTASAITSYLVIDHRENGVHRASLREKLIEVFEHFLDQHKALIVDFNLVKELFR